MESIIVAINIILAIILVVVVLLQRSEGGALGLGVSQDNFTSSRSVGTFLTKLTSHGHFLHLRIVLFKLSILIFINENFKLFNCNIYMH